ncbi:MAG: hypothetical protein ACFB0Z_02270 [Candidatus Phaeomarinobacter sp.]
MSDPSGTPKSGKWAALRLVLGLAAFPMAFLSFIIGVAAVPGTPDSYLMNVFPVFLFVLPAILVLSGIGCLLPIRSLNRVALPLAALAIAATLAPAALAFGLAALDGVIN